MKTTTTFSPSRLVIIITMTVFSFSSMTTAFFLMGIKAFPFFIGAALFYFIPYALIISEFTHVYKNREGGLYEWLAESLSEKVAFIASFLWYCSYFIWMISLFMKLWIPISILFFGEDMTKKETLIAGIPSTMIIGLLSIIIVGITLIFVNKGFKGIASALYLNGIAMVILILLSLGGNLWLWFSNQGNVIPNLTASFRDTASGGLYSGSMIEQLAFMIFAITAFGGLDTVASFVDKTGKQKNKFPKLLIISSVIVVICYFLGILLWSGGTNLTQLKANSSIHLGNLMYELMENLGNQIGLSLGLSASNTLLICQIFIRYTALTLVLSYIGLLSTIFYIPLRTLIQGTPAHYWHPKLKKINSHNMPSFALMIQGGLISLFILGICFSSQYVGFLYNQLTIMTNISRAIPYLLVALAYPKFKQLQLEKNYSPLYNFTTQRSKLLSRCVITSVVLSISLQIYQPLAKGNFLQGFSLVGGPVLFSFVAYMLYLHFQKKKQLLQNN